MAGAIAVPAQRSAPRSALDEELAGLRVRTDREGDPILLRADGSVVDTWCQPSFLLPI
jgi:hypothetical protein